MNFKRVKLELKNVRFELKSSFKLN